jgi:outer membrane protein assembly factor BamA
LIQDSTYIERNLGIDFSIPLFENLAIHSRIFRKEISPDSAGRALLGIPRSKAINGTIGLVYDTRDDRINPQKGILYQTDVQAGRKRNLDFVDFPNGDEKVSLRELSMDMELFVPAFKRQVLAVALHGRQITSSENVIPLPELFRLGGARSLRGFREDQFRGSSVAWINFEYRYILGRRSRFFIFTDGGYFSYENASGQTEAFKMGYGFGFRLETALGIMGVDYGLGRGESGGLLGGKVHVGLVNEF